MKVYSLERCYDHEGCILDGVFRTKKQAENARDNSGYAPDEWKIESWTLTRPKKSAPRHTESPDGRV